MSEYTILVGPMLNILRWMPRSHCLACRIKSSLNEEWIGCGYHELPKQAEIK